MTQLTNGLFWEIVAFPLKRNSSWFTRMEKQFILSHVKDLRMSNVKATRD